MRIVLLCLVTLLTACGNGGPDADGLQDLETKPEVRIPDGDPPSELETEDILVGTGEQARAGATVTVQYVGVSWSTGEEFDSSWERGVSATFRLDGVIPGWQQGIPGMKEGGRRRLVVPPDLAYGSQPPAGSGIAPDETLVFVVDLVKVG